jgi:hypothetical protein
MYISLYVLYVYDCEEGEEGGDEDGNDNHYHTQFFI